MGGALGETEEAAIAAFMAGGIGQRLQLFRQKPDMKLSPHLPNPACNMADIGILHSTRKLLTHAHPACQFCKRMPACAHQISFVEEGMN